AVVPLVLQPVAPGRSAGRPRCPWSDLAIEGHLRVRLLRARDGAWRLLRGAGTRRGNVLPGGLRPERQLAFRRHALVEDQRTTAARVTGLGSGRPGRAAVCRRPSARGRRSRRCPGGPSRTGCPSLTTGPGR